MVKLVFAIRRRQELSPEEFHRYWLEEHGPLARRLLDSLGARRWWDSLDAFIAAAGSEEGQRANETLTADEARFIDFARSSLFLAEEHALLER